MSIIQSIALGIIQGLTEFLPISSSGHLILAQNLLGIKEASLAFDTALHIGTFLALFLFFLSDWLNLIKAFFRSLKKWDIKNDYYQRIFYFLVIATLPGILLGLFLEKLAESFFRSTYLVVFNLIIVGIIFLVIEKISLKKEKINQMNLKKSLIIGFSQALAIIPGISRSGITITAGLLTGLKREEAARFSFLLATPIILGAGILQLPKIYFQGTNSTGWLNIIIGVITSFIVGFLCIKYLLKYLKKHNLNIFAYYRFLIAFLVIIYLIINHL